MMKPKPDWQDAPLWGCVLIGGKSSRMGQAKHLICDKGLTWVEKAVATLGNKVERVVISGAGELPKSLHAYEQLADIQGLEGPIAGILSVMRTWPDTSWLVTACDMPEMNESALDWLLSCRGEDVLGVLPDLEGKGQVEPLLAYYDYRCLPAVESIAAGGTMRINLLQKIKGVITPQPPLELRRCWWNVNSPQDIHEQYGQVATGSKHVKAKDYMPCE